MVVGCLYQSYNKESGEALKNCNKEPNHNSTYISWILIPDHHNSSIHKIQCTIHILDNKTKQKPLYKVFKSQGYQNILCKVLNFNAFFCFGISKSKQNTRL